MNLSVHLHQQITTTKNTNNMNTTLNRKQLQNQIAEMYKNYTIVFVKSIPNGNIEKVLNKTTKNLELVLNSMTQKIELFKNSN